MWQTNCNRKGLHPMETLSADGHYCRNALPCGKGESRAFCKLWSTKEWTSLKDCVQCLHDLDVGWVLWGWISAVLEITQLLGQRNSLSGVGGFLGDDAELVQDFISPVALSKGQRLNTIRLSSSVNATEKGDVAGCSCLRSLKMEKGIQCTLSYLCCLTLYISGCFCDKHLTRINFQCG